MSLVCIGDLVFVRLLEKKGLNCVYPNGLTILHLDHLSTNLSFFEQIEINYVLNT